MLLTTNVINQNTMSLFKNIIKEKVIIRIIYKYDCESFENVEQIAFDTFINTAK